MNTAPDTDFGREVITLLTDALSALLEGVNKLSEVNATWIDLNSFEYLIEDAKGQAMAAFKSGEAYCAIPILKPGDHFTLRTDEQDLDEEGQERITPAGSVWVVQELEPDYDPLMQYAVHCPQTGAAIHITHAELAECGYSTARTREASEGRILVLRVPASFDSETGTVFDAIDQGAEVLGCYPISTFNPGNPLTSRKASGALVSS